MFFYLCAALYALGQFIALLLLGDVQCQIGVTLTTIAEQLARISGLGIILWKIYDESAYKFEKIGLLVALGVRGVLGAVVIGFSRTEFVPVCFVKPGIGGPDIGQLIFDGLVVLYTVVRILVMFGLFKDQVQAITRSTKEDGRSQAHGIFLISLAYGGWWAGSFPHILGLGNLVVRVLPMAVTLLLLISILGRFLALAPSVPVAKGRLDSQIPPQSRSTGGRSFAVSSPNGSPVLTPRLGDIESNKRRNSELVFGDIIGAPSMTKVPGLNGGWALTKDQQERTRQKSLPTKSAKLITQAPVRGMAGISGPSMIPGPSLVSGPVPTGLPSGVRKLKTIDLKLAAEIEKHRIDTELRFAEEQKRQQPDEGANQPPMAAIDARTIDRITSVKRKAPTRESSKTSTVTRAFSRNTRKFSTITVGIVKGSNSPVPENTGTPDEASSDNLSYRVSLATEDNRYNSQTAQDADFASLQVPPVRVATLNATPEPQGKADRPETVLFVNQIAYDDPTLVKSLLSPEDFMTINTSAKDRISLGLTIPPSTRSSTSRFMHSSSRSPSRSPGSGPHVTKIDDEPPRILTPIMMRKKSFGASDNRPRSLWPGSPTEDLMLPKRVSTHRKSKSNPLNGPPVAPLADFPLPPLPALLPTEVKGIRPAPPAGSLSERKSSVKREVPASLERPRESIVSRSPIDLSSILSANPFPAPPIPHSEGNKKNAPNASIISSFPPPVPPKSIQRLEGLKHMGNLKRAGSAKEQYATDSRASGVSDEGYATAKAWIQNVRKASQGPSLVSIHKRSRSGTMDSISTTTTFTSILSEARSGVVTLAQGGWDGGEPEPLPALAMATSPSTLSMNGTLYDSDFDDKGGSEVAQSEVEDMIESDKGDDVRGGYSTSGEEHSIHDTSDSGSEIEDNVIIESEIIHDAHEKEVDMGAEAIEMPQVGRCLSKKLDGLLDEIIIQSSPKLRHFKFGDHIPTFSESKGKYGAKRRPPPSPIGWLMKHQRTEMEKSLPQKIQDRLTLLTTRKNRELDMAELMEQIPGMVEEEERVNMARNSLLESLEIEMQMQEKAWMDKKQEFRASSTSYLDDEEISPMTKPPVQLSMASGASSRLSQTFYAQRMRTISTQSNSQRESSMASPTSGSTWQRQLVQAQPEYAEKRPHLTVPVDEHLVLKCHSSPAISDVTHLETSDDEEESYEISGLPRASFYRTSNLDLLYRTPTIGIQSASSASSAVTEFEIDSGDEGECEAEEIEAGRTPMDALIVEDYEYESASGSIEGGFEPLPAAGYCTTPMVNTMSVTSSWVEEEVMSPAQYLWAKEMPIERLPVQQSALWMMNVRKAVSQRAEGTPAVVAIRPKMRKMMGEQARIESQSLWAKQGKSEVSMPASGMWRTTMEIGISGEISTSPAPIIPTPQTLLWSTKSQIGNPSLGLDSIVCTTAFIVQFTKSIRTISHKKSTQLPTITSSTLWGSLKPRAIHTPPKPARPTHQTFLWSTKIQAEKPSLGLDSIACSIPFSIEVSDSIRVTSYQRSTHLPTISSYTLWSPAKLIKAPKPSLWMPHTSITAGLWPGGKPPSLELSAVNTLGLWRNAPTRVVPEEWEGGSQSRKMKRRRVEGGLEKVSRSLWGDCNNKGAARDQRYDIGLWNTVEGAEEEDLSASDDNEEEKVAEDKRSAVAELKEVVEFNLGQGSLRQRRGNPGAITHMKNLKLELNMEGPRRTRKTLVAPGTPEHTTTFTSAMWATQETQAQQNWIEKFRRPSLADEEVVNSTSITFVITSPVSSVYDDEGQDISPVGSSEYSEDQEMNIEAMMADFSPVLASRNDTYSPYSIADEHFLWDEREVSDSRELGAFYESGSEEDSPEFDAPQPLTTNAVALLWNKQAQQDIMHSCSLWCQCNQLSQQLFDNIQIPTARLQRDVAVAPLEITSKSLWKKSKGAKPILWQPSKVDIWSLNGGTKTLYEIAAEQKLQRGMKLWTRARAHRGTNLVADSYVIKRSRAVGGTTTTTPLLTKVSGEMWRLNMQPSLWQRSDWRLPNEPTQSHLWMKHTASRATTTTVPHVGFQTQKRPCSGVPLAQVTGGLWSLELANRAKPQLWQRKSWKLPLAKQTNTHAMPKDRLTSCSYYQFRKPGSRFNTTPLSGHQSAFLWSAPQHSRDYHGAAGSSRNYKAPLQTSHSACLWAPIVLDAVLQEQKKPVVVELIADIALVTTPLEFVNTIATRLIATGTPTVTFALALDSEQNVTTHICAAPPPIPCAALPLNLDEGSIVASAGIFEKSSPSPVKESIPRISMAYTRFLWQHTPEQRATITVEGNDTATSLWSKERASRTTSKRPERLDLKKFSSGCKPVEKVSGPLWQPPATPEKLVSSPTFSNITENTRSTTPEVDVEFEEKAWLWTTISIPSPSEEDEAIRQPFLWAKTTASRISSSLPISSSVPRKFVSDAPLAQVFGSLWRKEKPATPTLWAKPANYWRLPEIAPKGPLWSREHAFRTTGLAPQPLVRFVVRQSDAPIAVVSGSLWMPTSSVDSGLAHRSGMGLDWLTRSVSCRPRGEYARLVASLPDLEVVLPPLMTASPAQQQAKLATGSRAAGGLLWCRETAEKRTSLAPERMVDAKVKKIEEPLEKVMGRLWNLEDIEKAKKDQKVALWVRPMEGWRMVSLEEIEKVKGAKMWIKETAKRTTEMVPERVETKARPAEEAVVTFTGGMWAMPKEARRTTKKVPETLVLKPKAKLDMELGKVSGPMWGVKSPSNTHPRSLWQKAAVKAAAPTSSPLWSKGLASRTTSAAPIRTVTAPRQFTEPLVKAAGDLWKNSNTIGKSEPVCMWKAKMKPTGLWHNKGLTPALSQIVEARKVNLWLKTPVHRADTFITDRTSLPASKVPISDKLSAATGSLWERKIVTTTIPTSINGLWGSQLVAPRPRRDTFASDSLPSPSLSSVSTLDDDLSTISPISEGNMAAETDRALIRSETNTSVTEGLWRRREAEAQAATKVAAQTTSLWNTSIAAPIEREVRKNKVLVLEKPPVGGKKKKALPNLTMKNLKELMIAEEGEKSPAGTSLWSRPSPMMERMFLALSSTRREPTSQPQTPATPKPEAKVPEKEQLRSPPASPATKEERHNPFSTILRIPSLRKHLKPVTSPVHAHAHGARSHPPGRNAGDMYKPLGHIRHVSEGGERKGEEGESGGGRREWLKRTGLVG